MKLRECLSVPKINDPSHDDNNRKVVVIVGPTAVGKSRLALDIASNFSGEIVSADSIQVYKGMDIGTAKPNQEERSIAPHHMIDISTPKHSYTVAEFNEDAREVIDNVIERKKLPVIVGGSGLYINSLIYDMDFSGKGGDDQFRDELLKLADAYGNEYLYDILKDKDPLSAERVHPNNLKRVVRLLERLEGTIENDGLREFTHSFVPTDQFEPLLIRLIMDRDVLYERIEKRVDEFVSDGLVDEVNGLLNAGVPKDATSLLGIGYKEIVSHIEGEYDLEEAISLIKRNTRRFAKRQDTWFKRYENAQIIDMTGENRYEEAQNEVFGLVSAFLGDDLVV